SWYGSLEILDIVGLGKLTAPKEPTWHLNITISQPESFTPLDSALQHGAFAVRISASLVNFETTTVRINVNHSFAA
ncbi:hypothetical protein H0H87_006572, partial [Tephrocybe sp. NHM501043]